MNKSLPLLVIGLWGILALPLPDRVSALTPLTRAEIQNLRNLVQLIPKNKLKKRPAQRLDTMTPGDGLLTGRASLADLRFNDGSLARVGEQAIFQFLPKTRSFKLSNGTALLLIPPGRGQTRIQTPSAAAAIRGSALFVRYDQKTDTTIVGALTNSGIEVSNKDGSQTRMLEAGQLMVVVRGRFEGLYDFDLRNFYETSDLVRELDLNNQNVTPPSDPAIASVQAETTAALKAQPPVTGEKVVENPSFLQLTPTPSDSATNNTVTNGSSANSSTDNSTANSTNKSGEALSNTQQGTQTTNNNTSTQNNNVSVDSTKTTTQPEPSVHGAGNENPLGGAGNQNTVGGAGNENNVSGAGNQNTVGGAGNENNVGAGNENNVGGAGNENNVGGAGNENNVSGAGNQNTVGGAGNENNVGAGNENNVGGAGNENNVGGAGNEN
ncbi:MAG: FecR domain-containing protein, partial [Nostoc sp. ChiSLP02]|nr:FecR domain-containing protein [Nostoc sp. ChiSLP02]